MLRRKLLPALVIPVVALLAAVVGAAPGHAVEPVPGTWYGTSICAEATLTAGARTGTSVIRTPLVYSIQPCAGTDPATVTSARWNLAQYFPGGGYTSSTLKTFAAEGAVTGETWGYEDGDLTVGILGELEAVCLITGLSQRAACVRVNAVGAAGTIVVTPLPVGDPLVTRTVTILLDQNGNPECAACV